MATSRVTVRFPCPVEQVWQTVTDLTHTAWRSDLNRVEVLDSTHFVEHAMPRTLPLRPVSHLTFGPLPWRTAICPAPGKVSSRRRRAVPS